MSSRPTLWIFALLLLCASLASAAPFPQTGPPMSPAAPAATTPGCAQAELPFLNPAPSPTSATCGTCSDPGCQGYPVGTVCAIQVGRIYRCEDAYGGTCGGTPITLVCNCWFGPLP